jgi:hypothetical protein
VAMMEVADAGGGGVVIRIDHPDEPATYISARSPGTSRVLALVLGMAESRALTMPGNESSGPA